MKFVAQYLREIPGKFPQKDGTFREWVDFQFLDLSQPTADGLEELIRYRAEKLDADDARKKLEPGKAYEIVINRLGWDKVPVIYRGRIGAQVKA
jgi:hypothetical protein